MMRVLWKSIVLSCEVLYEKPAVLKSLYLESVSAPVAVTIHKLLHTPFQFFNVPRIERHVNAIALKIMEK